MKTAFIIVATCISFVGNTTVKDSTIIYHLPDSVKAVQMLAEINYQRVGGSKFQQAGIKTDAVQLCVQSKNRQREIVFSFPVNAPVVATGGYINIKKKGELKMSWDWASYEDYKFIISVATDSAGNFSLYSGYVFLSTEHKWKLIGTCKIAGQSTTLLNPASFYSSTLSGRSPAVIGQIWCQRNTGSWKNMNSDTATAPAINWFGHVDSAYQRKIDTDIIEAALSTGKTDAKNKLEGLNYKMMKEGTGVQVSVTDTVTAFYKLTLLSDGSFVDGTTDKPAVFPLKRLIKGWQIGVPLCKVGGKILLVVPSDLAYTIRTRSPKIPPNSVLVFEIEVIDTKPALPAN